MIKLNCDRKLLSIASLEERSNGWTHKFSIPADFLAKNGGSTQGDTVQILLLDASGQAVLDAFACVKTKFTTKGTLSATVGTESDADSLITSANLLEEGLFRSTSRPAIKGEKFYLTISTQASTGAPSDITDGQLDVYLKVHSL